MMAKEFQHAVALHDIDLAHALLRDLAYRHRVAFDQFMAKYGDSLPDDAREELGRL